MSHLVSQVSLQLQMKSSEHTQVSGATVADGAHRLGHHVHLLEVHQSVQARFVALVRERHVLQQQRHEGNHRRLQLPHKHAVRPVVATRVDKRLEFRKYLAELGRNLLPRLR